MQQGVLEVIAGPMFAGKTSMLLKKARAFDAGMVLIKPSFDTRYGICEIKTHDGLAARAFNLSNTKEVLELDAIRKAKAVFFDEIQFFTDPYFSGDIIDCVRILLNRGQSVYCCGLDMNWKGECFKITSELQKIANRYVLLQAKCSICNQAAPYTYKSNGSEAKIELGAADIYEPRCARHFPFCNDYTPENIQKDACYHQGELFEL